MSAETPRVWIGCLACYNSGNLIGQWYDADEAGDVTTRQVHEAAGIQVVNDTTPAIQIDYLNPHEELWVMDHENFGSWLEGECSPAEAQRVAELITELGDEADAAGKYRNDVLGEHYAQQMSTEEFVEDFRDHYRGEYDSPEGFAESWYEETMPGFEDNALRNYVDWERVARDMGYEGMTFLDSGTGTVFVFYA